MGPSMLGLDRRPWEGRWPAGGFFTLSQQENG